MIVKTPAHKSWPRPTMKKSISIAVLFILAVLAVLAVSSSSTGHGDNKTVRVLFIGNSLTSANNLPGMVAGIARSHGHGMVYDSYTPGGARLANHASDPKVPRKIREKSWDFVVFQEQSQYPGFSRTQLSKDVFPHAKRLSEAVKRSNNQSQVVFYMTMARRNGDPDNKDVSPELLTYEGMQGRVNRCYREMARSNGALVAPVGQVWRAVRQERPSLNLYSDDVHPNKTGTYLAACVFYATFYGEASAGSRVPLGVNRASAQYIQTVVDRVVLGQ